MPPGRISTEYTIWCGACEYWEQEAFFENRKAFEKAMRKGGWAKRRGVFVCPTCLGDKGYMHRPLFVEMTSLLTQSKGGES